MLLESCCSYGFKLTSSNRQLYVQEVWIKTNKIRLSRSRQNAATPSERCVIVVLGRSLAIGRLLLVLLMLFHDLLHLLFQLWRDDELVLWVRLSRRREVTPRFLRRSFSRHLSQVVALLLRCHRAVFLTLPQGFAPCIRFRPPP